VTIGMLAISLVRRIDVIVVVVVVLLFGGHSFPSSLAARQRVHEFKKGMKEGDLDKGDSSTSKAKGDDKTSGRPNPLSTTQLSIRVRRLRR